MAQSSMRRFEQGSCRCTTLENGIYALLMQPKWLGIRSCILLLLGICVLGMLYALSHSCI